MIANQEIPEFSSLSSIFLFRDIWLANERRKVGKFRENKINARKLLCTP